MELTTKSLLTDVTSKEIDTDKLRKELDLSGAISGECGVTTEEDEVNIGDTIIRIYGDSILVQATLDSTVLDHTPKSLAMYKEEKADVIDKRTGELIAAGYVVAAKTFSLSKNAQLNLLGIHGSKDSPALTYPIKYNTKDDQDTHIINNSAELETFFLTALGTKKAHLDSGTVLKDSIRAAIDRAGVDAVIDNR